MPLLVRLAAFVILALPLVGSVEALSRRSEAAFEVYAHSETPAVLRSEGGRLVLADRSPDGDGRASERKAR